MVPEREWIDIPEMVGFNVTGRCNLKCAYCFQDGASGSPDPSYNEVADVLDQLNRMRVKEVLIEGGELLCAPFIERLLAKLKDCCFRSHLISNGTLVNQSIARMIKKSNASIGISVDGPTEESNRFRGAYAFHKAIDAINTLVREGVPTYVNCTVTNSNADLIGELVQLCSRLHVSGIVMQQLHCSGKASASFYEKNFITLSQLGRLKNLMPELKDRHRELHFVESEILDLINARDRYHSICEAGREYMPKKIFRCATGRRFCLILSNLDVVPCGIMEDFVCGNLSDRSLDDIWKHSEKLSDLRELSGTRVDRIVGCENCTYNPICDGGCRADMYNHSGDWLAPHIFCPYNRYAHYSSDYS